MKPYRSIGRSIGGAVTVLTVGFLIFPKVRAASSGTVADDDVQVAVLKAAHSLLMPLLNTIPEGSEKSFGFASRVEFIGATLAKPYEMFSLEKGGAVTPLDTWRVPIVASGRFRALITVVKRDHSYSAVGIGAAPLAEELGSVEKATANGAVERATSHKSLLRAFSHGCDFVAYDVDPRPQTNLTLIRVRPLMSAVNSLADKGAGALGRGGIVAAANSSIQELSLAELQTLLD